MEIKNIHRLIDKKFAAQALLDVKYIRFHGEAREETLIKKDSILFFHPLVDAGFTHRTSTAEGEKLRINLHDEIQASAFIRSFVVPDKLYLNDVAKQYGSIDWRFLTDMSFHIKVAKDTTICPLILTLDDSGKTIKTENITLKKNYDMLFIPAKSSPTHVHLLGESKYVNVNVSSKIDKKMLEALL